MKSSSLLQKISLINETTLNCFDARKEKEIVQHFTDAGIKILNADFGFSFFRKDNKFVLLYNSRKTPYTPAPPRKQGLVAAAFRTKKVQLISDAERKLKIKDHPETMRSVAIIPIVYKKNNYGTIHLCFKKRRGFNTEDATLCGLIGNGAAQAITINRFYNQLEGLVAKRTTQLRNANEQLKEDSMKDQAILSSIGEGLLATDEQARIVLVNPHAESLLGWTQQEISGKNLYDFQILLDEQNQPVPLKKRPTHIALSRGQRVTINHYSYVSKQGRTIPLSITVTPIRVDGKITGSIQVFRDISKEREIDRAKSELISLASHQLRTPLAGINWYVEALIKEEVGKLNKDQKKYLGEVYRANQKLVEMVYDFLNVSRIELGTFNLKITTVDVRDVAKGILSELEPNITAKKLKVNEHFEGQLSAVRLDHKVIRLILQNLITNAVKYTPAGGEIEISVKTGERHKGETALSITVSDTGVGIPKKDQGKIFSKLFRADNIKTLDADGTGLGLYIVKSFTELCGGEIKFASKEGQGTKFSVLLPVSA